MDDPFIRRPDDWSEGMPATLSAPVQPDLVLPPAGSALALPPDAPHPRQGHWMLRTVVLLIVSCVAFGVAALWLSRLTASLSIQRADSEATSVVRAHLAALERGDFRAAYDQFSPRYRRHLPFHLFEAMVMGHWQILQGGVVVFPQSATPTRVVLHVNFEAPVSMGLTADFTLIRSNGRWWIDDVSWGQQRSLPLVLT
jgi:hypothetical protein